MMARDIRRLLSSVTATALALTAACGEPEDLTGSNGGAAIAYIKRPLSADRATATAEFGGPTMIQPFVTGGDLYIREQASPKANEYNLTASVTRGDGDVAGPEVSPDGTKLVFAMRCGQRSHAICSGNATWNIWQYDMSEGGLTNGVLTQLTSSAEYNDVDPVYLPNGKIVFCSDRQQRSREVLANLGVEPYSYMDEDGREPVRVLHVMDRDGRNIKQISFSPSHDTNPTVLDRGQLLFSRWDNFGTRSHVSLYRANPDGTKLSVAYGAHTDDAEAIVQAREMDDGLVLAAMMPLAGTFMGGRLVAIDIDDYADNHEFQPTFQDVPVGAGFAPQGRFSGAYPIWDGSGRALVAYTPARPTQQPDNNGELQTVNDIPAYGLNLLNLLDQTLVSLVLPDLVQGTDPRSAVLEPVALAARRRPALPPKPADPNNLAEASNQLGGTMGVGVINIKSVYESDGVHGFGDDRFLVKNVDFPISFPFTTSVLPTVPKIPGTQVPDISRLKSPTATDSLYSERPARFLRISRAVPAPPRLHPNVIGRTSLGMQEILGYAEIQPDGSAKVEVPADVPLTLAVLDKQGRAFQVHTGWIQVRPGETLQCAGCHSSHMQDQRPLNNGPIDFDKTKNEIRALIDGESDPVVRAQLEERYPEPLIEGHPAPNNLLDPVNHAGLSMAEVRYANPDADFSRKLRRDIVYRDFWTAAYNNAGRPGGTADPNIDLPYGTFPSGMTSPIILNQDGSGSFSRIVINYPDHIQPLWDAYCTGCHNQNHPTLDLRDDFTVTAGWSSSYDRLLRGSSPRVVVGNAAGGSRASWLVEVLFHQKLRSSRTSLPARDHSTTLPPGLRRLVVEWIDGGAQYYNDPFIDTAASDGLKDYRTELRRYQ